MIPPMLRTCYQEMITFSHTVSVLALVSSALHIISECGVIHTLLEQTTNLKPHLHIF